MVTFSALKSPQSHMFCPYVLVICHGEPARISLSRSLGASRCRGELRRWTMLVVVDASETGNTWSFGCSADCWRFWAANVYSELHQSNKLSSTTSPCSFSLVCLRVSALWLWTNTTVFSPKSHLIQGLLAVHAMGNVSKAHQFGDAGASQLRWMVHLWHIGLVQVVPYIKAQPMSWWTPTVFCFFLTLIIRCWYESSWFQPCLNSTIGKLTKRDQPQIQFYSWCCQVSMVFLANPSPAALWLANFETCRTIPLWTREIHWTTCNSMEDMVGKRLKK